MNPSRRRFAVASAASVLAPAWLPARATTLSPPVAAALREIGLVLVLRHAVTEPGIGDPPGFTLGDCRSQRNLSAAGREQARRVGQQIQALGLAPHIVRSSAWCRCIDTAELAFGKTERWPALNSFFGERGTEPAQTQELRRALERPWPGHVEAWVTHMVNITALTGQGVAMGETFILARGSAGARLLARLPAP
jgi:hypothetical protein